jgi:calcineurin-like phosphoesterase family protein
MNTHLQSGKDPLERKDSMRFFTSDTHFGHKNIIKYSNRPFADVSHMNEALIANWNAVVGPLDTVFHLGDVALGPWEDWDKVLTRLNGYKVLVVGNHDRIFKGEKPKMQERFADQYAGWFDEIHHNVEDFALEDGTKVNLSHFPYEADHFDNARYMEFRLKDEGTVLVHGHTHAEHEKLGMDSRVSRSVAGTLQIHVGQDAWNYRPVSEGEVLNLIKSNM